MRIKSLLVMFVLLSIYVFFIVVGIFTWRSCTIFKNVLMLARFEDVEQPFYKIKERVLQLIIENDGYIPVDPYLALIQSGKIKSFYEFWIEDGVITFDMEGLPVRINPDLKQNRKIILFWARVPGEWRLVCYCDGTTEVWTKSGKWIEVDAGERTYRYVKGWKPPSDIDIRDEARQLLRKAGYPDWHWHSVEEKRQWIEENKNRLIWDNTLRMYVVKGK